MRNCSSELREKLLAEVGRLSLSLSLSLARSSAQTQMCFPFLITVCCFTPQDLSVEQLTALMISVNVRYKTHAGLKFTNLPEGDPFS